MRRAFTLLELLVALAILGALAVVVAIAPVRPSHGDPVADSTFSAVTRGRRITMLVPTGADTSALTLDPDGIAVGDSSLRIDRLTARRLGGGR